MNLEKLHRQMWTDIAEGKVESKSEWIYKNYSSKPIPFNLCFACEEAKNRQKEEMYCNYCPITDVSEQFCCAGLYSEYETFIKKGNLKEKRRIAAIISELPWEVR